LAPGVGCCEVEWLPVAGYDGLYSVTYKKTVGPDNRAISMSTVDCKAKLLVSTDECDYEVYVSCPSGRSATRLLRPGFVPGTVINYIHPDDNAYAFSGRYLGTPSLAKLPGGTFWHQWTISRAERGKTSRRYSARLTAAQLGNT